MVKYLQVVVSVHIPHWVWMANRATHMSTAQDDETLLADYAIRLKCFWFVCICCYKKSMHAADLNAHPLPLYPSSHQRVCVCARHSLCRRGLRRDALLCRGLGHHLRLRHAAQGPAWRRLEVGRLQWGCGVWQHGVPRVRRRPGEPAWCSLGHEPTKQRSRTGGELSTQHITTSSCSITCSIHFWYIHVKFCDISEIKPFFFTMECFTLLYTCFQYSVFSLRLSALPAYWLVMFFSPTVHRRPYVPKVQVPRPVGQLWGQDMLVVPAWLPGDRRLHEGQVWQRLWDGGGKAPGVSRVGGDPEAQVHLLQASHGPGPGLLRELAELLRAQPRDGFLRHEGPRMQPDLPRHRRVRPALLWPRPQHPDREAQG